MCLENSSFSALNSQHCKRQTLHWSKLWRGWKLGREWFSQSCHWLTPACLPHFFSINAIGKTGKTLNEGKCLFFQHGKSCSMLCSISLRTGWGNVIPGSDWICGSNHTAALATKNLLDTRFHESGKLQQFQLSKWRRRHSSLIWPFARMETVERIVLSKWQWSLLDDMHVCSLFGTGDYCELDCCTNAHWISKTGKTLNEGKCWFFQYGKSCLMLGSFLNRKRQRDSW